MNRFFLPALFVWVLPLCVLAQSDDLDRIANEAARRAAAEGLAAGSKVVEQYYYVAKYAASGKQRATVIKRAKEIKQKAQPKDRYLAIPTTADSRSKGKVSVMVWDTQSQEIVGNNVYDLNAIPAERSSVKLDSVNAAFAAMK